MISVKVQRKKKKIVRPIGAKHSKIKVGFPRPVDAYDSHVVRAVSNGTVQLNPEKNIIDRAIVNEYGLGNNPARPFLKLAVEENKDKYKKFMERFGKNVVDGKITLDLALDKFGNLVVGDIQQKIVNLRTPPNAPATIKAKGSSNPLIDSSDMKNAVTYVKIK